VTQNSDNQKITVCYQGKEYEAHYSTASGLVNVEIFCGANPSVKTTRQLGMGSPESIAKLMALEILIGAKERGELN